MEVLESKKTEILEIEKTETVTPDMGSTKTKTLDPDNISVHTGISQTQTQTRPVIGVKKLHKDALMPSKKHATDACFDLYANEDILVKHNQVYKISTGLGFEIPEGYKMMVYMRSGLGSEGLTLPNCVGIIDPDYRGEVMILATNHTKNPIQIKKGDRVAQFSIEPITHVELIEKMELTKTVRGTGGFGSTGKA